MIIRTTSAGAEAVPLERIPEEKAIHGLWYVDPTVSRHPAKAVVLKIVSSTLSPDKQTDEQRSRHALGPTARAGVVLGRRFDGHVSSALGAHR